VGVKKQPASVEETAATYTAKKPAGRDKAVFRGTTAPAKITPRSKKLDLEAEELALHAEISAAAARDLGR